MTESRGNAAPDVINRSKIEKRHPGGDAFFYDQPMRRARSYWGKANRSFAISRRRVLLPGTPEMQVGASAKYCFPFASQVMIAPIK